MKRWVLAALVVMVFNLYAGEQKINIHLKDGSVFSCDKILSEKANYYILEKNGKKLYMKKQFIDSVEVQKQENNVPNTDKQSANKNSNPKGDKVYVIDDLNFVRTVFYDPYASREEQAPEVNEGSIAIKVVSQSVSREGDKIKFEGKVQNQYGKEVENLKMVVSALDAQGNVVLENVSQLSPKLSDKAKVPFTFIFTDKDSKIVKFNYRFEAIERPNAKPEQ
jgi:hypothetical protein